MKNIKIWIGLIVVLIIIVLIVTSNSGYKVNGEIKVGAILPMTGPASVYGDSLSKGMKLALNESGNEKIKLTIEDSQANPKFGLSAYQKLLEEKSDVIISSFSSVSTPLKSLALQNKIPLIMTIVSGANMTNDFAYRYYAKPEGYAAPAFSSSSPIKKGDDIAILYRNDEYGNAVKNSIQEIANKLGNNVVIAEGFMSDATDYRTELLKIKEKKPKSLIYVVANPGEAIKIVNDAVTLDTKFNLVEASVNFSDIKNQKNLPAGRTYYSTSFSYLQNADYSKFIEKYKKTYNEEPYFSAPLGYDIIRFIAKCSAERNINECLSKETTIDGVTGKIENILNHEINPPLQLIEIKK